MQYEVSKGMEGKGIDSALTTPAFRFEKARNKPVILYCPYVLTYIKRHSEALEQLDKEYHH